MLWMAPLIPPPQAILTASHPAQVQWASRQATSHTLPDTSPPEWHLSPLLFRRCRGQPLALGSHGRAGGRSVGGELEHGFGWQQNLVSGEWGENMFARRNPIPLRSGHPLPSKPCHDQPLCHGLHGNGILEHTPEIILTSDCYISGHFDCGTSKHIIDITN